MMYVRRELDDQHGTINLQQMFHEMEARPDALPGISPGISPAALAADREALEDTCREPLAFAQQQLAHRAPMGDPFVSGSGIDHALDAVFDQVCKLHRVHTGGYLRFAGLKPDPEWLQAFTVAWYRPGKNMQSQIKAAQRWANR
jgi:hypothetical protein